MKDLKNEVLKLFREYGIDENTENDLTKKDLADCAEKIVETLTLKDTSNCKKCNLEINYTGICEVCYIKNKFKNHK